MREEVTEGYYTSKFHWRDTSLPKVIEWEYLE